MKETNNNKTASAVYPGMNMILRAARLAIVIVQNRDEEWLEEFSDCTDVVTQLNMIIPLCKDSNFDIGKFANEQSLRLFMYDVYEIACDLIDRSAIRQSISRREK